MAEYIETPGKGAGLEDQQRVKRPRRFKVLLLNDDYTTMDFVVMILREVFRKSNSQAERIMLSVHKQGMGVAGIYVKDIAEAKILETHEYAREEGFPLRCNMEPE